MAMHSFGPDQAQAIMKFLGLEGQRITKFTLVVDCTSASLTVEQLLPYSFDKTVTRNFKLVPE